MEQERSARLVAWNRSEIREVVIGVIEELVLDGVKYQRLYESNWPAAVALLSEARCPDCDAIGSANDPACDFCRRRWELRRLRELEEEHAATR